MSATCLSQELRARGIFIELVGGRLRYLIDGRPHRVDAAAELDRLRDLLERFEERAAIIEFDAGLPRAEAERRAWHAVLATVEVRT